MNRKERRTQVSKERKEKKQGLVKSVEEKLHDAIHEAVNRVIPKTTSPADVPYPEVIRGLGMVAAAFSVQLAASLAADPSEVSTLVSEGRAEFLRGMGDYYDGIAGALGVEIKIEPEGPTLVLP